MQRSRKKTGEPKRASRTIARQRGGRDTTKPCNSHQSKPPWEKRELGGEEMGRGGMADGHSKMGWPFTPGRAHALGANCKEARGAGRGNLQKDPQKRPPWFGKGAAGIEAGFWTGELKVVE